MSAPDLALLRFLRAGAAETAVLNEPAAPDEAPPPGEAGDRPARLVAAARALRVAASADGGHTLDYARLAALPAYARLRSVAAEFAAFDPRRLATRAERLSFWINAYNALAIDAAARFGVRDSVREQAGFFHRAAYCIGGLRLSLEAIEHGVLRGNRPALPRLAPPFAPGDARLALCLAPPEPRIHFALHCATRSCPPLRVFTAANVDAELEGATAGFIAGGGVTVDGEQVRLSAIFAFYADDFGGREHLAAFIAPYLESERERGLLRSAFAAGREQYEPYDWALNAAAFAPVKPAPPATL